MGERRDMWEGEGEAWVRGGISKRDRRKNR
jgi:hypothetical protein